MSLFSRQKGQYRSGGKVMKTIQRLCECPGARTREQFTPQQCRRCGFRIDRQYDEEIHSPPAVSITVELPEADWEYPYDEHD